MTIHVERRDTSAVLCITGRFDFGCHTEFRRVVNDGLAIAHIRHVVVDLSKTEYLDSAALGMLLVLLEKADAAGLGKVTLKGAQGMAHKVLTIARFDRMFAIN
jgi:HptB-dependent secretion and biofilm anti anti-sigma factor